VLKASGGGGSGRHTAVTGCKRKGSTGDGDKSSQRKKSRQEVRLAKDGRGEGDGEKVKGRKRKGSTGDGDKSSQRKKSRQEVRLANEYVLWTLHLILFLVFGSI
jgi:hypothetical protein